MKNKIILINTSLFFVAIIFFSSCSDSEKEKQVYANAMMGGIMCLNETGNCNSLNPISVTETPSYHIGSQIFEGLVKFNQTDLTIKPAIARTWDMNENQTIWTFHLRQDVVFHADSCFKNQKDRKLSAHDIKWCFEKLCTFDTINSQFEITFKEHVLGALETFEATKSGKKLAVSGIKVVNDSTLVINLNAPFAGFLNILAMQGCWIYPKEAYEKYGNGISTHPVGTGPFYLESMKAGQLMILKKNPDYYAIDNQNNKLPYLDELRYTFIKDKKLEILAFKSKKLDMVNNVPVSMFHELIGNLEDAKKQPANFQTFNVSSFNTNYLGFNIASPVFRNKNLRLAINLAIDRKKITDYILKGEVTKADGVVPFIEAFEKNGYNYKKLQGFDYDLTKAKTYLNKAGYPNGKGFPKVVLQINTDEKGRNILVADAIKNMLQENLNITIDVEVLPFTDHMQKISAGETHFFRFGWTGDYLDPESFLRLFYGKDVSEGMNEKTGNNFSNFKNARFDSLLSASFIEKNLTKRYTLLSLAEQIVLDEAPVIPLFYEENLRLEQSNVCNFPENAISFMDLSAVYLNPKKGNLE